MAIYKNSFLTRFADRTGLKSSDFLSMYAPQIIKEILNNEKLFMPKASWFIGIPGSGKSSILRLFGVDILSEIIRQQAAYNHLYEPLVEAKIIVDDSIKTVGIYVQIDELYSEADNVTLSGISTEKLFFTLFDLRVAKQILAILEKIYKDVTEPNACVIVKEVDSAKLPPRIFSEKKDFHTFDTLIRRQEQLISQVLTSFPGAPIPELLELHNRFASLDLISAQQEFHNVKFILMIDDAHDLYPKQLQLLKNAVEKRNSFPRWVATRKHIYPIQFLVGDSMGNIDGREIYIFDLDNRLSKNKSLYKRFIKILVEKRLKSTFALSEYTTEQIEGMIYPEDLSKFTDSINIKKLQYEEIENIKNNSRITSQAIDEYIDGKKQYTPLEVEAILIKANRFIKSKQPSLFPELNIDLTEIASKDKQAAKLFLKKRAKVPLYSGFDIIVDVSNYNVEQFLRVFSPFIDRLIYRVELDKDLNIKPAEQYNILKKAAKSYIENVIPKLLYGKFIYQLVDNLGRFFSYRTYEPNAPHAPGVTQFAITSSDMEIIKKHSSSESHTWLEEIICTLTMAIANNVIVPEKEQHQGARDSEKKVVFSINRLLCIKYELPIQRGDFQIFSLEFLWEMCKSPLKPVDIKSRRLNRQRSLWSD